MAADVFGYSQFWLQPLCALTERIFAAINVHLADKGLLPREGTVVDATIIAAPSSTKNQTGTRDPEMHQTKKGKQWHFGNWSAPQAMV